MEILDNLNELGNKIINNLDLKNMQEDFLKSNIGQIANTAIDIGLKSMLPDHIENEVIEVKDALISGGIREGVNTAIENTIEIGKKFLGIENSNFNSIDEARQTIQKGDLISNISKGIDFVLEKVSNSKLIPESVLNTIKSGKDLVLNNINTNVEDEFINEMKAFKKIEKYIDNWEKYYTQKDVVGLDKEFNKIEKQIKKILPIENMINKVNAIRNINDVIKNSENFDFSEVYLDLAKNL